MKFSQRIGKTPIRETIQIEGIDSSLENSIWNEITYFFYQLEEIDAKKPMMIYGDFWIYFLNKKFDEIDYYHSYSTNDIIITSLILGLIKKKYNNSTWFEKYDLIEFLINTPHIDECNQFIKDINSVLKKNMAAYQIIDRKIIPITTEIEVSTIEEAITDFYNHPVESHLRKALEFLSNRNSPNYRNSVKESISAVEAYCCSILNDSKATLGQALKKIDDKYTLHPSHKSAFEKLYGYTSDSSGIRHALTEDNIEVSQEDAKFMLITCTAFINYLKSRIKTK